MPNIQMCDHKGGGISIDDYLDANYNFGHITTSNEEIPKCSFAYRNGNVYIDAPNLTSIPDGLFQMNTGNIEIHAPEALYVGANAFSGVIGMQKIVLPKCNQCYTSAFYGAKNLKIVDLGGTPDSESGFNRATIFSTCTKLSTIILRASAIWQMINVNALNATPFASGGSGGTIYIPKTLYDHLGDGTADDYKAASNWSTYDGYGTITWAKIEGSYYETHYGDGTLIPSA